MIKHPLLILPLLLIFLFGFILLPEISSGQTYTHSDTLKGSNGGGRDSWHVLKYDLDVKFNYKEKSISGSDKITFRVLKPIDILQIDLQEPLTIDSCPGTTILTKEGNAWFLKPSKNELVSSIQSLCIYYHGKPKIAIHPPWEGGLIWTQDKNKNPWISIACQGIGASVWFPCKDLQSDKADSAEIRITCPDSLVAVSNGNLKEKTSNQDKTNTYDWVVGSPINAYCISAYIGDYRHFSETTDGEQGELNLNYWVLPENFDKAKEQFKDAARMMKALEYWFGPYPFYEDGYKLVDAPFLGMEHQSAIAYGNNYVNGYRGLDLSGTGWGLKWDFIIVHESAHEWFGNSITAEDIADNWIHESFANYAETLFTEYYYGKNAGSEYCLGMRKKIKNDFSIIGPYGVFKEGSVDMYNKGGNMIHTIRQIIDDDEKFRMLLRSINKTFYHRVASSIRLEDFITSFAGIDLSGVFEQYLRTTAIPVLEYKLAEGYLSYRWTSCIKGFHMPVKVTLEKDRYSFIYPTENFQQIKIAIQDIRDFKVDENFYVFSRSVL